jgi:hypothetical protein
MWQSICVVAFVAGLSAQCLAAERTKSEPFARPSCMVVRYYVAKYSVAAAETWARNAGATEAQIESAKQCVKLRTAQGS